MVAAGVYIPPPPPSFTDPDARMDAIRRKQEEQEAWRQQVIAEREIQELQECTFAPKLHTTGGGGSSSSNRRPTVRQPTGPVVVRGLGRYLEVREMARRKEAEKAELEAKAFKANPKSSGKGGSGITQPKPFKLSKARDPNLKERLAEEAKQRELAQCTFKPTTNESDSRAVIEQVRQYCKTPPHTQKRKPYPRHTLPAAAFDYPSLHRYWMTQQWVAMRTRRGDGDFCASRLPKCQRLVQMNVWISSIFPDPRSPR